MYNMNTLKKSLFITTVIISMFFIACGSDGPSNNNNNPQSASISITTQAVKAYVGGSTTIPVTARNTDFTVSAPSNSGCVKSGENAVVCKPSASGIYTVTITATVDASKNVSATVTVPELEFFAGNGQTLYADETESAAIEFNAASNWTASATDSDGGAPAWLSLSVSNSIFTADDSTLPLYGTDDDYHALAVNVSGTSGNKSIRVTLQPNDSMADRTATITITTSKGQVTTTIKQLHVLRIGTPLAPGEVSISISPLSANTNVGVSRTFTVTRVNTADFTLSAPSGSGCVKSSSNAVICTPTTAGTYNITVRATAGAAKTALATLTTEHTVTFDSTDGSNVSPLQVLYNSSLGSNMPPNPTKTGYDFVGWNTSSSETSGNFTAAMPVTSNITVYAIWKIKAYTVTFNSNGGSSVPSAQVQYDSTVPAPTAPTRTGYDFDGWYSNSGLTTKVAFPYTATGNITLYAKWIRLCTVTFNSNGGDNVPPVQEVPCNSSLGSNMPSNPTRTGYDFVGWNTNSSASSSNFAAATSVTSSITVYAIWKIKTYTVTFNSNGGSSVPSAQVQYRNTVSAPTAPTQMGYVFDGWYSDSGLTSKVTFSYQVLGDITLYAKWIRLYTVTFNSNGGSNVSSAQVGAGNSLSKPADPTRTDYVFDGWHSNYELTDKVTFPYTPPGDITLYAKWIRLYTVTFNSNGGSSVSSVKGRPGESISAPTAPTRTCYDFDGWYSDYGLTSKVTFPYLAPGDITLYAKWIKFTTVTFNSNSGSSVPSVCVRPGTRISAPTPDPIRTNYEFDGWYSDSGTTTKVTFQYTVPEADTTLYAKWTRIYTVTFNSNGGSSVAPVKLRSGTPLPEPVAPTRTGYDFDGWYVDVGLATKAVFPHGVSTDKTLFAKWTLQGMFIAISSAADLDNVRANLSGNYILTANISLSSYANWMPIGTSAAPFTGIIIGGGYKITALKIDRSTENYVGLFGYIRNGAIIDFVLEDVDIKGRSYVGAVAGYMQYGNISGGSVTGQRSLITSYVNSSYRDDYYSGGITGYMEGGTITDAYSAVAVTSSVISSSSYNDYPYHSGGIAGYVNGGKIIDSHSSGNISSIVPYSARSGGIAGYIANGGEISGSSSTGSIISNSSDYFAYSGGIAGYTSGSEINDSFSAGNISSSGYESSYSGGITGYVNNGTITECYSAHDISSSSRFSSYSGGIAGYAIGGEISCSSSAGNIISNSSNSSAYSGGIAGYATNGISITRSFSASVTGNISSSGYNYSYSGGITGYVNSGTITECYSARDVSSSSIASSMSSFEAYAYSGGIAGYASGSYITNCYSRGNNITSSAATYYSSSYSYSGGIAGYAYNTRIYDSAAAASAITARTGAGRIAGYINTGNSAAISNNFALSTMIAAGSAALNTGASYHGVNKTDAQLKQQSTYSNTINGDGLGGLGWKFGTNDANPWKMPSGGYPIFYWQ